LIQASGGPFGQKKRVDAGTVDKLLTDVPKLKSILIHHVVSGKVMAADAMKMDGKSA